MAFLGHKEGRELITYPVRLIGADEAALRRLIAELVQIVACWQGQPPEETEVYFESYEPKPEWFYIDWVDSRYFDPIVEELGLTKAVEDVLHGVAPHLDSTFTLHFRRLVEWFDAVERKDVIALQALLDQGVPVDLQDRYKATALHYAARAVDVETIGLLLARGADPNAQNFRAGTPVTSAVVEYACDHLGKPGEADPRPLEMLLGAGGRLELREAVALGDLDLAHRLCDEDPSIDVSDDAWFIFHDTYLMTATKFGHAEMVRFLLDRGAHVEGIDDLGRTALIVAAESGRMDIVDRLLQHGADVDHADWSGLSPLAAAAVHGHDEVVARLLALGAKRGLLDAIHLNDEPLVSELVKDGLAPDAIHYHPTPIRFAIMRGHAAIVARLLEAGPVQNLCRYGCFPPLVAEAAATGRLDVVRLLVDHGLDPREVGGDGLSPLDWAEREGQAEVADYLRGLT